MDSAVAYFRQKAAQCRQLAEIVGDRADPIALVLLNMAREYDGNADALETKAISEAVSLARDEKARRLQ